MVDNLIERALEKINANHKVLFVWSGQNVPAHFESTVAKLQQKIGNDVKVSVEHSDRLTMANYENSTFDAILANILNTDLAKYDSKTIGQFLKLLKPKGFLLAAEKSQPASALNTELKLNGFLNVNQIESGDLASFYAEKPNFELGSASKLKFASKPPAQATETKPKVWQFSANDIQEDDLINTDDLLDDLDLKKPTPLDKFDCGESKSGKKKACKNCSCGLAEELEKEATDQQKKNVDNFKSACGSCYLGDAFRCASCPYLGMPAFKPGEKVQLNENFIKSDI